MSFRSGFVGLLGLTNAGKSTLMNAIVGEKIGIVSPKPQTTRQSVVGVYNDEDSQVLFVDAPGVVKAEKGLNAFLQSEWEAVIRDSDILAVTLNTDESNFPKLEGVIAAAAESKKPWLAVITKMDTPKAELREGILRKKLQEYKVPVVSVGISPKLKGERNEQKRALWMTQLLAEIKTLLPETPGPLFDPEILTTQGMKELAAEYIREQCFRFLHQEVPFGLAIRVNRFKEEGNLVKIYADIVVNKANHKPMVLGKEGQTLKKIGTSARIEIEKLMAKKVYLNCHVQVRNSWTDNKKMMQEMGYE